MNNTQRTLKLDSVRIEWLDDDDPDLSWLDQTDKEMGSGFEEQSRARKESYGYGWHMIGCRAIATVSYPFGSNIGTRLEILHSGGLWGIESDSDKAYMKDIENEQLMDLVGHLSHFGVKTTLKQLRKIVKIY